MLRIIARLDIKNGLVIKGIHLEGQRRIGDPIELARRYYEDGIDEIFLIDSVASLYKRSNLFHLMQEVCRKVFVPITMGGGICTVHDVKNALASGADKVAINTALVRTPSLINEIVSIYGSQCLVGSIEAKKYESGWQVYVSNGREPTGLNVLDWAIELEQRGVGELLVTSVDQEGTQRGFDVELYKRLHDVVRIPVIACGGAGRLEHLSELEKSVELEGMAIASLLHYEKVNVALIKGHLSRISMR